MKKAAIILSFICLTMLCHATGIEFFHGSFAEAISKARAENKLVFVDCYTTWCGPCRMLQNNIFPEQKVGEFFNENFISIKIDCEHEDGPSICQRFAITAYPTLIFVNGDGKPVYRTMGYRSAESLIDEAKKALGSNELVLGELKKKYDAGDHSAAVLYDYATNLQKANQPYEAVMKEYLDMQKSDDMLKDNNCKFIFDLTNSVQSPGIKYLETYSDYFKEKYGKQSFDQKVDQIYDKSISTAIKNKDKSTFDAANSFLKKYDIHNADEKVQMHSAAFYMATGDNKSLDKAVSTWIKKYHKEDAKALNQAADQYLQNVTDGKMLNKALKWALASTKLDDKYYNNLTLAGLYRKLGYLEEAQAYAGIAMDMGKKENVNYWPAQDLMNKITSDRAHQPKP